MKDRVGRDIKVGDKVAWGAGGRRSYGLRLGVVENLVDTRGYPHVLVKSTEAGYRGGLQRAEDVVVLR